MKNTLFCIMLLCGYYVVSAQDVHQPAPMTFSQPHLVDTGYQSKFFYSWNWINGPRALNHRYHINAFHTHVGYNNAIAKIYL